MSFQKTPVKKDAIPKKDVVQRKQNAFLAARPKVSNKFMHPPKVKNPKPWGPPNPSNKSTGVSSNITTGRKSFVSAKPIRRTPPKAKVDKTIHFDQNEQYDILYIDRVIKETLSKRVSTLPELYKELHNLAWLSDNAEEVSDKMTAVQRTDVLRKMIKDIEHGFDLTFYILRTHELLQLYSDLKSKTQITSFVRVAAIDKGLLYEKSRIIDEYLSIAKNYIDLSSTMKIAGKVSTNGLVCEVCFNTDFEPNSEDNMLMTCKECFSTIELIDNSPSYKDSDRVNMSNRYTYSCRAHYIEAINCFECKQRTDGLDKVANILLQYMEDHNLTPKTVKKDHLYMFLTERGISNNYKDVNWLFSHITSTPGPDISAYRNELLSIHDYLEEAFSKVKRSGRINSLTVNYKLYKSLQLVGYACRKDDFYFLKTPNKQTEHDEIWREMMIYLAEKYPDDVTLGGKKKWRIIHTY